MILVLYWTIFQGQNVLIKIILFHALHNNNRNYNQYIFTTLKRFTIILFIMLNLNKYHCDLVQYHIFNSKLKINIFLQYNFMKNSIL